MSAKSKVLQKKKKKSVTLLVDSPEPEDVTQADDQEDTSAAAVMKLQQMSYRCPGLHGPGARQNIEKKTFSHFLQGRHRAIIPLIQRRYCWHRDTIQGWWQDVVGNVRDCVTQVHCSGKVRVKLYPDQHGYFIIDGQQRITTTSLLAASIRDACLREAPEALGDVINSLNEILFCDLRAMEAFKTEHGLESLEDGQDLPFCRLSPSFSDRKSYFKLILEGIKTRHGDEVNPKSYQEQAKTFFDAAIQDWISSKPKTHALRQLKTLAMDQMGMTLIEIENEINLGQVFLWFQEKSLFGAGALLYNRAPGVDFRPIDLVRNLLVAPFLQESLHTQENLYRTKWLDPIENKYLSLDQVSQAVNKYREREEKVQGPERFTSSLEAIVKRACEVLGYTPDTQKYQLAVSYAQFVSLVEWKSKDLQDQSDTSVSNHILQDLSLFVEDDTK